MEKEVSDQMKSAERKSLLVGSEQGLEGSYGELDDYKIKRKAQFISNGFTGKGTLPLPLLRLRAATEPNS